MTVSQDISRRLRSRKSCAISAPFRLGIEQGGDLGSHASPATGRRIGIDAEKLISLNEGFLRIENPIHPGWGRHAVALGPVDSRPGTWIAATILNGHNSSQGGLLEETLRQRFKRWLKGADVEPWQLRVLKWTWRGDKRETLWLFRKWVQMHRDAARVDFVQMEENLAFGWMQKRTGGNPSEGACFVMRAAEADNGELCIGAAGMIAPAIGRVTNIPIVYFSAIRGDEVAFFVGTTFPNVPALPTLPMVRQVSVVPAVQAGGKYACIQQAALGQVGFVSASHVYGLRAGISEALATPGGTALFADPLRGAGALNVDANSRYSQVRGDLRRSDGGLITAGSGEAALNLPTPAGFLRILVDRTGDGEAELRWRCNALGDCWSVRVGDQLLLGQRRAGQWTETARCERLESSFDVQILDDGLRMRVIINGNDAFGEWESVTDSDQTGVQLALSGIGVTVRDLEVQPREIRLPEEAVIRAPATANAKFPRVVDSFTRGHGPLHGRLCETASAGSWKRTTGKGEFVVEESCGARVVASPQQPICGRTSYTLPWSSRGAAALEALITPPGEQRGLGANGRAGVVFWQDDDNYLIVSTWLDDGYGGASISAFFRIRGTEEIYNAVWTNVGDRVSWGRDYRLAVTFDGNRFVASVDGEPVLVRALTDVKPSWPHLRVNRVGITANWEWGLDAGSVFREFRACSEFPIGNESSTDASARFGKVAPE